jgi:F420-dependent oxidoreductase-like protein
MQIGISITNFSWPAPPGEIGPTIARLARAADDAGIDSIWTMDHFFQIQVLDLPPEDPMIEAFTTLTLVASHTRRARVGTLVAAVPYRHPGVLVKTATTVDVLSGGRLTFGVGAGSPSTAAALAHEAGGLGIPFPSLAERFERLEELLVIARQMWDGNETPFEGRHYRLDRPMNSPNSLQRPRPPILIGGSGERRTLRLVAQYADACNLFDIPGSGYEDDLRHKLDVLRAHCDDVGRDPAEIEVTTATLYEPGPDSRAGARGLLGHLEQLAAAGVDHAILSPKAPWDDETLEGVASILPEVHALGGRPAESVTPHA